MLTFEEAKDLFSYNRETGIIKYKFNANHGTNKAMYVRKKTIA